MASRKLFAPSTALYQDGRGSEPMIDVGRMTLADPLSMALSPAAQTVQVLRDAQIAVRCLLQVQGVSPRQTPWQTAPAMSQSPASTIWRWRGRGRGADRGPGGEGYVAMNIGFVGLGAMG